MLIFGRRHLEAVGREYIEHYNSHRPSLGQLSPPPKAIALAIPKDVDPSQIQRANRLAGLIHEYRLVA
jgi:hypothetical protein